jgi:UDP-glucuronate 4-epimerase
LTAFIDAIEIATGKSAARRLIDMQPGDVPVTWANAGLLKELTGYEPRTDIETGVRRFVEWYRDYYRV